MIYFICSRFQYIDYLALNKTLYLYIELKITFDIDCITNHLL